MIVNIAFFDKYMLSEVLEQNIKGVKILSKNLCVSHNIRLRYKRHEVFTYNITKGKKGVYKTSYTDYSFGVIYQLEVEDLSLVDLVLSSPYYHKTTINVGIIEGTLEDISKYTFKLLKNTKALCWCCNEDNQEYLQRYKNKRNSRINISKLILLGGVLKENEVLCNDESNGLE